MSQNLIKDHVKSKRIDLYVIIFLYVLLREESPFRQILNHSRTLNTLDSINRLKNNL